MPEFSILSVQEAMLRLGPPTRIKPFMDKYIGYINQLRPGQAGVLTLTGDEKISTIRNWLTRIAKEVGIALIIKRGGEQLFFWREQDEAVQQRRRRL